MTDNDHDTADNMRAAAVEAHELNTVAQPLGYAVTTRQAGGVTSPAEPTRRRFTVHRVDQSVAGGSGFDTADEVRAHLDRLANLPRWRLDLDDESVEFDRTTLTVTDKRTGEHFCLKGWRSFGISGVAGGDETSRAHGARHIVVVAENPPTIGRWHKADAG